MSARDGSECTGAPTEHYVVRLETGGAVWEGRACCRDHAVSRLLLNRSDLRGVPLHVLGPTPPDHPDRQRGAS